MREDTALGHLELLFMEQRLRQQPVPAAVAGSVVLNISTDRSRYVCIYLACVLSRQERNQTVESLSELLDCLT